MGFKVFIAAPWSRRTDAEAMAQRLHREGIGVTSRWHIPGVHEWNEDQADLPDDIALRFAWEDREDIAAAHGFVILTNKDGLAPSRGGKHVEFGFALAHHKFIIVVGDRYENIYQQGYPLVPDVEGVIDWLTQPAEPGW